MPFLSENEYFLSKQVRAARFAIKPKQQLLASLLGRAKLWDEARAAISKCSSKVDMLDHAA